MGSTSFLHVLSWICVFSFLSSSSEVRLLLPYPPPYFLFLSLNASARHTVHWKWNPSHTGRTVQEKQHLSVSAPTASHPLTDPSAQEGSFHRCTRRNKLPFPSVVCPCPVPVSAFIFIPCLNTKHLLTPRGFKRMPPL